ncbi:hypothetical protein COO60DRAFT_1158275 [Scenedesmus sp. NREL 46B-D3]|nr:hypothetical protein COO60DRAFT_1158275 [Scenedesmus sp. NREL 46B-D3]
MFQNISRLLVLWPNACCALLSPAGHRRDPPPHAVSAAVHPRGELSGGGGSAEDPGSTRCRDDQQASVLHKPDSHRQVCLLIGMFARLTDSQAATLARLLNSLSPGQLVLSMQLLEKFNFGVNNIGQSIPAARSRGRIFNIGPSVRVTVGGGGGGVRRGPFGLLG